MQAAKEILDQTYGKYTDYDKEAAVHDAILVLLYMIRTHP